MAIEALLAILTSAALICLVWGNRARRSADRTQLDKRLRRYGGRAYQLTDDEQEAGRVGSGHPDAGQAGERLSQDVPSPRLYELTGRANLKLTWANS